jgi:hypothetical protein
MSERESSFSAAVRLRELALAFPRSSDRQEANEIADAIHRLAVSSIDNRYYEAKRRCDAILNVIYSTHGYVDGNGEIDAAAKFRAIERLARLDWDEEGMSHVV